MLSIRPELRLLISIIAAAASIILISNESCADTVHLKNKGLLKGIVIEEYVDRILFSTIDGEEEIMKSEISHIEYSERADNLISLGNRAFENGYYRTALKYYLLAQKANPNITSLEGKIYDAERKIHAAPEARKREHLAIKTEILSGYPLYTIPHPKGVKPVDILKIKFGIDIGIDIGEKQGRYYIKKIKTNSPFAKAGLKKRDAIIAVWSKLCDYLTLDELQELLNKPDETMVTVTIQRDLVMKMNYYFDAEIEMKWEGAIVESVLANGGAERSGIKIKDHIMAINRESIRYAPLKTILNRLRRNKRRIVTVQRKINIFK